MDPLGWVDPARQYVDKRIAITKALMGMVGDLATNSNGARQKVADAITNAPKFQVPDQMDESALAFWNPAGLLGKIVYHGSPHKFDKFDASKIGTGEGAQAFSHGLYMAEKPNVAKEYQFVDARIDPDAVKYGGVSLENLYNRAQMAQERAYRLPDGPYKQSAISKANAELGMWESMMTRNHPKQVIEDALNPENGWPEQAAFAKSLKLDKFSGVDMNPGYLYKADLPDEFIPKMLDWDKPVASQPPEVINAMRAMLKEQKYLGPNDNGPRQFNSAMKSWRMENAGMADKDTGQLVMQWLSKTGSPEEAASKLKAMGVPGVKYLDGFSRSAGQGSYNYVVFPGLEDQVKILERNGVPIK